MIKFVADLAVIGVSIVVLGAAAKGAVFLFTFGYNLL